MPNREQLIPVTGYIRASLKSRAMKLASAAPRLSLSRIIEASLERALPDIEKELKGKA